MEQDVSGIVYKRNVLLLTHEDVRRRNGEVYTPNLGDLSRLRRSKQFKNGVVFADKMCAEDVQKKLEEAFPVLKSKRFACAARAAQDSARLEFHGDRRIWDGRTIKTKLRGQSALYIVIEDEQQEQQISGSFPQVEHFAPAAVQPANRPVAVVPSNQNAVLPASTSASVASQSTSDGAAECCSPKPLAQLVSRKRKADEDFHRESFDSGLESEDKASWTTGQELDG